MSKNTRPGLASIRHGKWVTLTTIMSMPSNPYNNLLLSGKPKRGKRQWVPGQPARMRRNYRCNKPDCRKRVVLTMRPEEYVNPYKCPGCKRVGTMWQDPEVHLRHVRDKCLCNRVRFPHRRGTFLSKEEFCIHANVEIIGDEVLRIYKIQPGEVCPF